MNRDIKDITLGLIGLIIITSMFLVIFYTSTPTFQFIEERLSPLSNYYFVGIKYYINGVETDDDAYAPVRDGDIIKICGKVYKSGAGPQKGIKVKLESAIYDETVGTDYTDGNGYFEFTFRAEVDEYDCGARSRQFWYVIARYGSGSLDFIKWRIAGYADCPTEKPRGEIQIIDIVGYAAVAVTAAGIIYLLSRRS